MVTKPHLPLFTFTLLVFIVTLLFSSPSKVTANEAALRSKNSSPVGFLEQLKGSHKGDKVKGINDLKKYLEKYGYLDCKNHNHVDDDFDEHLEDAIRVYQINFNLNPTGILEEETISSMMKPRCGVADIINGTTSMRVATMKHNYSEVPIRIRYKVNPGYAKWPKYNIYYAILPPTPPPCKGPTKNSFQVWQKISPFKFSQTGNIPTSDMRISGHKREWNSDAPFDGPNGALAHASYPTGGDLHYDLEERWTATPGQGDGYDCMGVALHEIGHLLGLDHSSVNGAVMYPYAGVFKALHQDDIQGLKALYKF